MASLDGGMFLEFLHNVSFKYDGEDVFFDENGDPPPRSVIVKYVARYSDHDDDSDWQSLIIIHAVI